MVEPWVDSGRTICCGNNHRRANVERRCEQASDSGHPMTVRTIVAHLVLDHHVIHTRPNGHRINTRLAVCDRPRRRRPQQRRRRILGCFMWRRPPGTDLPLSVCIENYLLQNFISGDLTECLRLDPRVGVLTAVVTKFYVKPSTILTHYDAKIMVSHVATDQL